MRTAAGTGWALCRARTHIVPKPRDSANTHRFGDNSCSGTPGRAPGDLFSSFGCQPPPLRVRARPAESSGCGRGRRACGRAAQTPSRPQTHPRIPRLRRLAARACHAPAPAADSRSDFGVAFPRATGRDLGGEEERPVRCDKKRQVAKRGRVENQTTTPRPRTSACRSVRLMVWTVPCEGQVQSNRVDRSQAPSTPVSDSLNWLHRQSRFPV